MIRRAWSATTAEGVMRDRFVNGLSCRVLNEIEPPFGGSVELVPNWVEIADRMFYDAGEPTDVCMVDEAARSADLTDLYDVYID